jgi:hypothetical protein
MDEAREKKMAIAESSRRSRNFPRAAKPCVAASFRFAKSRIWFFIR